MNNDYNQYSVNALKPFLSELKERTYLVGTKEIVVVDFSKTQEVSHAMAFLKACTGDTVNVSIDSPEAGSQFTTAMKVELQASQLPGIAFMCNQVAAEAFFFQGEFAMISGPGLSSWLVKNDEGDSSPRPYQQEFNFNTLASKVAVLMLECDEEPSQEFLNEILKKMSPSVEKLYICWTPCESVVGHYQVLGRLLEVLIHCMHELIEAGEDIGGVEISDILTIEGVIPLLNGRIGNMAALNDLIARCAVLDVILAESVTYQQAQKFVDRLSLTGASQTINAGFSSIMKEAGNNFSKVEAGSFVVAGVNAAIAGDSHELVFSGGRYDEKGYHILNPNYK